jgi:transcriptional regulator with XRE-family HTH domain
MLADLVRTYRRRLGMTQEELAAAAKISVRSIRKIEAGTVTSPRPSTLRALANAFDLPEPARVRLHGAPAVPVEAANAPRGTEPLILVAIDAAGRPHDDRLYVQVTVRSATREYSAGPFPVERGPGVSPARAASLDEHRPPAEAVE